VVLAALTVVGGLAVLTLGAELVLRSATSLARRAGVPPMVVGLTVVSVGTSVPELAVGIDAARQGNPGIAVGNLIGSSIYNISLVLGITTLVVPAGLDVSGQALDADLLLMLVVAALCVPVFVSGRRISRLEGGLGVAGYVAYLLWLVAGNLG